MTIHVAILKYKCASSTPKSVLKLAGFGSSEHARTIPRISHIPLLLSQIKRSLVMIAWLQVCVVVSLKHYELT